MRNLPVRRLFGGLALAALGLAALPAGADIIAGDGFNYIPLGASLNGANGGSVLPPGSVGWRTGWAGDAGATISPGLTYNYDGPPNIGIGNSVTLGVNAIPAGINRDLGNSSSASHVWMRMLYNPGLPLEESTSFVTPLQLGGLDGGFFNLTRQLDSNALNPFSLTMSGPPYATGIEDAFSANFNIGSGTHMLVFELIIDQNPGGNETLSMYLDPTAAGGLGTPITLNANILEGGDYLALFAADGNGDRIDELVLGTSLNNVIGQLNDPVTSVPEVSGTVMMAMVGFLGGGVVWYRRRQKAVA